MNTGTQKQFEESGFDADNQFERESTFTAESERESESQRQTDAADSQIELKYRSPANAATAKLAKGLGLFSIALGAAEVLAPAQIGELIGVGPRYQKFIPALGLREIAHGVGILMQDKPTESVWSRVAGDAVDLAFLGAAFTEDGENNKNRLAVTTLAVLGVTALDVMCAQALSAEEWSDLDGNFVAPTTVGQTSGRQSV